MQEIATRHLCQHNSVNQAPIHAAIHASLNKPVAQFESLSTTQTTPARDRVAFFPAFATVL